jgi:hypothetical protein
MASTTAWYREQGEWKRSLEEGERREEITFIHKYREIIAQL